jgi:phage tail-like protein
MAEIERADLDPAATHHYAVEIDGIAVGWFTECGGLAVERTVYPYQEGGINAYVHQLPDRIKHTNITLKRGLADESLVRWFAGEDDAGLYEAKVERRSVSVVLYDAGRAEVERWNLERAYPVKWSGPSLVADGRLAAIESVEIAQETGSAPENVQRAPDEGAGEGALDTASVASSQSVDLPALARAIYALLREDLRIESERLGRRQAR